MSYGNRGLLAAFAGLAALFVALGTGAYFGALHAPHYGYQTAHPANRSAQAEQGNPSQIARDRAGLPYFAERIASGPDPNEGSEREKRDLAAQESMSVWAFWLLLVSGVGTATTMIGTGFLLWQIMLTREAVTDTGKATVAMERQNSLAADAQRAWVTLAIEPRCVMPLQNSGLSVHVDVIAKNIGESVARNFDFESTLLFKGHAEGIEDFTDRITRQIESWKAEYWYPENASLLPRDTEIDYLEVEARQKEIKWWGSIPDKRTTPVVLAAAIYRTVSDPKVMQLSWRTWYLGYRTSGGRSNAHLLQFVSTIEAPDLIAIPMHTSLMHEEYPANDDNSHHAKG